MAKKTFEDYVDQYIVSEECEWKAFDRVLGACRKLTGNGGKINLFDKNGNTVTLRKCVRPNERGGAMTKVSWWNETGDYHVYNNSVHEPNIEQYVREHLNYIKENN